MANLIVVGSEECSTWNVTQVLKESPAFPVLWERKCEIANYLGVDTENIWKVNQESILGRNTWSTSIHNLIRYWVADKGSEATLGILVNVLEENNLKGCSEFLLSHFLNKSSTDRRYKRIPTALLDFKSQNEKSILIFLTPDVFITCEKIRENGSKILSFEHFLKILSSNECNKNLIVITSDFKELKTVFKQWSKYSSKLIIITGVEFQKEAEIHMDETCHVAVDKMEWDELSPAFQHEIEEKAIKILRENFNFEGELDDDLESQLCGEVLVDLNNNNPLRLFKPTLPQELPYYVKRQLSTRNIISIAALKAKDCPDILVVSGMARSELSNLCKESTDDSTSQCVLKFPSVRFIKLDSSEHFETLCLKCKERKVPVHLLRKGDNGRLKWIRSDGNVELLRNFMDCNQDNFSEEEIETINSSEPICISDSPGMGKSVLLAETGRRLQEKRTVIFMSMCDFIVKVKEYNLSRRLEISAIKYALINMACLNELGKFVLNYQVCFNSKCCLELLLDGLDEADTPDIELSFQVLQAVKTIKSIRLWVSTRPHLLPELENLLGVPGYNITPFKKENQVEFLIGFWSGSQALNHKRLKTYIDVCLKSIQSNLNSEDKDIVGIPLQCYMIGVIFEKEAVDFCKSSTTTVLIAENGINSIANLYEKLIDTKLAKYSNSDIRTSMKQKLFDTHVYYSLKLIFPELLNEIKLEKMSGSCNLNLILKAGILEAALPGSEPTFIHRTFAEYFVARFAVNLLKGEKYVVYKNDEYKLAKFIFNIMLKTQLKSKVSSSQGGFYDIFDFTNQTISYLFNSVLSKELDSITFPLSKQNPYYWRVKLISLESIQAMTHACIFRNYFNIYIYLHENGVFKKEVVAKEIFTKDIIYFVLQYASLAFIKNIFSNYENIWNIKIANDETNRHILSSDNKAAALAIVIQRGKYPIVEYLVNEKDAREILFKPNLIVKFGIRFNLDILLLEYLIKFHKDSGSIKEKLEIYNFLNAINPLLIQKYGLFQKATQPLLWICVEQLHEKIQQLFFESEVDIIDLTLAITSSEDRLFKFVHKFHIRLIGSILNLLARSLRAPLQFSENFRSPPPFRSIVSIANTTNISYEENKFTDAIMNTGKSQLVFLAMDCFENVIQKLIKYGSELNCKNSADETLLHRAAYLGLHQVVKMLIENEKMDVNVEDSDGLTPLDYASKKGEETTCKLLESFGGISGSVSQRSEEQKNG